MLVSFSNSSIFERSQRISRMNKVNVFGLSLLLVPFLACAMSSDEKNNYIIIRDEYKKADNELNELYKNK